MAFIIAMTPTRAFRRLKAGESVVETYEELTALQERLLCDIYIKMPDEYGQRRVFLYDPRDQLHQIKRLMKQNNSKTAGQIVLPEDYHYYKVAASSSTGKLLLRFLHSCQKCEMAADHWCKKFGASYYCDDPKYFAGGVSCVAFDTEPDRNLWKPFVRIGEEQYYLPACEVAADKVEIPSREYALHDTWDTLYLRNKIYEEGGKLYVLRLMFRPETDQTGSQGRPVQADKFLRRAIGAEQKRLKLPVMTVTQLYQILGASLPQGGRTADRTPIVFLYGASLYVGVFYPCLAKSLEEITMQQCRTKACLFDRQEAKAS